MSIERTKQRVIADQQSPSPRPGKALHNLRKVYNAAILGTALSVGSSANLGCSTFNTYQAASTGYAALNGMSDPVMIDHEFLPSLSEMQRILHHALGDKYYYDSLFLNSDQAITPNANPAHLPETAGFEQINLPPEAIVAYVQKTLPDNWYSHINYIGINHDATSDEYPGLEKEGSFGNFQNGDIRKVNFTYRQFWEDESIQTGNIDFLFHAIDHEITHSMDFQAHPHLTTPKKLILMYLIFRITQDSGRPKFAYPESIKAKSPADKQKETYLRMREFLAELVSTSLRKCHGSTREQWIGSCVELYRNQYEAKPLPAKRAAQLLQVHLRWTAPKFQPEKVTEIKQSIIDQASAEHQIKRAHKIFESVPDQNLRNLLLEALNIEQPLTRQDLGYQSSILGVKAFVEFKDDPDFQEGKPLQIDNPTQNVGELQGELQAIVKYIFNIRANQLGIKQRDGRCFEVELGSIDQEFGSATFREFIKSYKKLSPVEKNELLKIARTKLSVLNLRAPGNNPNTSKN